MPVATAALLVVASGAIAQPADVPIVFTQSPRVFQRLFDSAHCGPVTALLLGDSQETSPGGAGAVYIPRLNYEFWSRYLNAPATPYAGLNGNYGGGVPPAEWLLRGGAASPGVGPSRLPAEQIPPGLGPCVTSNTQSPNVNGNQSYGFLLMLQHDAANVASGAGVGGGAEYFRRDGGVYVRVFGATHPGSGEIQIAVKPNPTSAPSYFRQAVATFTTSMGLDAPAGEVRSELVGPLPFDGQPYVQVEIIGDDPTRLTDVVTARFENATHRAGWSITSLSRGGYQTSQWLMHHGDSGRIVRALAPDVVFIAYGANDAGRVTPPTQYKADVQALIAQFRAWTRPDLPVVLLSEPYRHNWSPAQAAVFDPQPAINREIAQEDPLVCAVNTRPILDAHGWNATGQATYLVDLVHYTPAGAVLKARIEAEVLFEQFGYRLADADRNDEVDGADITAFLSAWFAGRAGGGEEGDFDGDGAIDATDLVQFLAAWFGARQGC